MFNDEIQGTAACAVAGILAADKITATATKDDKFLFLVAGMAISGLIQQKKLCSIKNDSDKFLTNVQTFLILITFRMHILNIMIFIDDDNLTCLKTPEYFCNLKIFNSL